MPHLLPKAAEQNSAGKQKKQARIFSDAKIRGAHFPAGGIFVSGLACQRPRAQRFQAACTFLFGTSRPKSPVYIQQPQRPTRQSPNAFCSFGFPDAKTRGVYFFSIQNHRFRLDRPISPTANPLSIPAIQPPTRQLISFRRHPADSLLSYFFTEPNASRPPAHSLPAPAGQHLPPPFFSYRPTQSLISQLSSSRLGLPTPYTSSHYFFNIYKVPSSHQVSLPTILPKSANYHLPQHPPSFHTSSFFYFLYRRHPPGFRLSVPPSHHFPNALHFFRPAAASPTRRPNAKRSFARGCSLQGCRWCGRGARVSSFFFMFLFFLLLFSFLFFSISLAPRLRRDAFIFLFAFVLLFVFSFCFFAFIFAFFFLLFSLYFSSDFLFLFFLCFFFLLFLSFYFCSYLCFLFFLFAFTFIFAFFIFSLCFSS